MSEMASVKKLLLGTFAFEKTILKRSFRHMFWEEILLLPTCIKETDVVP